MTAREALAQRLRQLMTEHRDSSTTLAQVFGIKSQSVDSWLRTGRIGKDRLPGLARRYSVSVAWLLGQDSDDDEDMLAEDERKLIADYRALRDPLKNAALAQVAALRAAQEPPDDRSENPPPTSDKPAR